MRDFAVKIDILPQSFKDKHDEISVKFALWQQIQEKLKECRDHGLCSKNIDTTVVEINIGLNQYEDIELLKQIQELCDSIEYQNIKLKQSEYKSNRLV